MGKSFRFRVKYVIKTCVVPKLSYAAILGQDFFETFDCIIDFKVGYLKIGRDHLVHFNSPKSCSLQNDTNQCKTEVPDPQFPFSQCELDSSSPQQQSFAIHAAETYILPLNSESVIPATFRAHDVAELTGLIEPNTQLPTRFNICGAVALVFVAPSGLVPFCIINPTAQPIKIFKWANLETFFPQASVINRVTSFSDNQQTHCDTIHSTFFNDPSLKFEKIFSQCMLIVSRKVRMI